MHRTSGRWWTSGRPWPTRARRTSASTPVTPARPATGPPGLYREGSCVLLAEGVRFYAPMPQLWSDDADKERYIYLPPDRQIDTSDADGWVFPIGTTFWKNFLIDGQVVETRIFEKIRTQPGYGSWRVRTFAWNDEGDSVTDVTLEGGVIDTLGTTHDIPSEGMCLDCHDGPADAVNGFSALPPEPRRPRRDARGPPAGGAPDERHPAGARDGPRRQ